MLKFKKKEERNEKLKDFSITFKYDGKEFNSIEELNKYKENKKISEKKH